MLLIIYDANNLGNVLTFAGRLFVRVILNCVSFQRGCAFHMSIPNNCYYPTWKLFVSLSKIVKNALSLLEQRNLLLLLESCYKKYTIYDVK